MTSAYTMILIKDPKHSRSNAANLLAWFEGSARDMATPIKRAYVLDYQRRGYLKPEDADRLVESL